MKLNLVCKSLYRFTVWLTKHHTPKCVKNCSDSKVSYNNNNNNNNNNLYSYSKYTQILIITVYT